MERERRSSLAVMLVIGVAMLPVLYVLSIGPMMWLSANGYIPPRVSASVPLYAPLQWTADRWPAFDSLLDWYTGPWMP